MTVTPQPMAKILRFGLEPDDLATAEQQLSALLAEGWQIVTAGGAGGGYGGNAPGGTWGVMNVVGFIVLQRNGLSPKTQ